MSRSTVHLALSLRIAYIITNLKIITYNSTGNPRQEDFGDVGRAGTQIS